MASIELIATIFGLLCVALTVRQHIACWPTGLIMVSLYILIFHQARLYSDMGLQVVYVFLQIYGWYHWLHGGRDGGVLIVSRLSGNAWLLWLGIAAVGTVGLGASMRYYTDAALPFWDAATTVLSLIAQWLMARKILESWLIWVTVDVLSIGIYLVKGLYPTAVLYMAFLGLATLGFFAWRKTLPALQPA
ncbi:MAG: nicotinamide mononucleotide transporter [Gammaproteobacteria bacterium]|nr:nicotinamide mononucleotide transporter [Gammaproteobacteria bacterium]